VEGKEGRRKDHHRKEVGKLLAVSATSDDRADRESWDGKGEKPKRGEVQCSVMKHLRVKKHPLRSDRIDECRQVSNKEGGKGEKVLYEYFIC